MPQRIDRIRRNLKNIVSLSGRTFLDPGQLFPTFEHVPFAADFRMGLRYASISIKPFATCGWRTTPR